MQNVKHIFGVICILNCLQIRWEYYQDLKDFRLAGQIDVERAVSDSKVIQNILNTALDNVSSLQVVSKSMLYFRIPADASILQHEPELTIAFAQDCVQASHKQLQHQRDVFRQEGRNCTEASAGVRPSRNTRKKQSCTSR